MSIELLVLLFVFIVLPLLQQLIRAARQRDQPTPRRTPAQPPSAYEPEMEEWEEMEEMEPPPRVLLPPAPAVPWLPATEQHKLFEAMTVPARPPARAASRLATPAPAARRSARRHKLVASLRKPRDLRNAFVLTTILGPCRANEQ
jgi:hypothetical protein